MRKLIIPTLAFTLVGGGDAKARTEYLAGSTSYCLRGAMSDGSYTRWGSIAMNRHRLGTHIRITRPSSGFFGRTRFTVRDHIGWGSDLDFWAPTCTMSRLWGRRTVRYRIVG
jgi:hypothetical protein